MILSRQQFESICVAMGFALLALARFAPPTFTIGLLALIAVRVWLRRRQIGALARFPRYALLAAVLILSAAQFGTLIGSTAGPIVLSAFLVLKLFETESRRDAFLMFSMICFLVMSLFLFDQGLLQILFAMVSVIVLLRCLLLMHPESSAELQAEEKVVREKQIQFKTAGFYLVSAIPFAIAAFFLFPRLTSPLWGSPDQFNQGKTGLSDSMTPGQLSSLALDDTPAFRVRFDGAIPTESQRYWRGPVLWNFDGETWSGSRWMNNLPAQTNELQVSGTPINYQVSLEKGYKNYLFALDVPIAGPPNSSITRDRQMFQTNSFSNAMRYRASSYLNYRLQRNATTIERNIALELPIRNNPRTIALANAWRIESQDDPNKIIQRAMTMFNREFTYSLEPPPLVGEKTDDFLFNTKTGYCEHFSSSFVILMRAAGIPARVVTGYLGGFWNRNGGYLLVANSDAHAWAEVWLEGRGWVRIDPTSAVAPERINRGAREFSQLLSPSWARSSWLTSIRMQVDRVRAWWNDSVVEFNVNKQLSILDRIGFDATNWKSLGLGLLIMGAIAIALPLLFLRFRERQRRDPLRHAYQVFLNKLSKAGLTLRLHDPPLEVMHTACHTFPQNAERIRSLSQGYVFLRYACDSANPIKIKEFTKAVKKLRLNRASKNESV